MNVPHGVWVWRVQAGGIPWVPEGLRGAVTVFLKSNLLEQSDLPFLAGSPIRREALSESFLS